MCITEFIIIYKLHSVIQYKITAQTLLVDFMLFMLQTPVSQPQPEQEDDLFGPVNPRKLKV